MVARLTIVFLLWSSFGWCSGEDAECVAQYATHRLAKLPSVGKELRLFINDTKFVLYLTPEFSLVNSHSHIAFVNDSDLSVVDASKYSAWRYSGHVNNDIDNSQIFCIIDDQGYLHGSFNYEDIIYLIEPKSLYVGSDLDVDSETYDAILYKSTDVYKCRHADHGSNYTTADHAIRRHNESTWLGSVEGESSKHQVQTRKRRPAESIKSIICDVRIAVDYPYFKHVANLERDRAVASVVNLMRRVDTLFRQLDLNQDGQAENLGFYIREILLYLDPLSDLDNGTAFEWDPVQFFTDMQRYNFSDVCAGILFTYRRMQSSEEYGPSIIKSTFDSTDLGLCSNSSMSIPSAIMDNYGSFISNAVPVNFMHNGSAFKEKEPKHMVIQLAHQLAQLFGSPTDDDTISCNTSDPSKMNIMAYPPPPGLYRQNYRFSHCSKAAITSYLKNMSRPCLKFCKGPSCSMKRSMDFLSGPYNIDHVSLINQTATSANGGIIDPVLSSYLLLITMYVFVQL